MNALESLGLLSIVIVFVFLIIKNIESKDRKEKEDKRLIPNSESGLKIIDSHQNGQISSLELDKQLKQVMSDPTERQKAKDNAEKKEIKQLERKQWTENWMRERRKIGYKFQDEIFEIFDTNHELHKEVLHDKMKNKFKASDQEVLNLVELWQKNDLISVCSWDGNAYQIGNVLTDDGWSLDENDITHAKWLQQQNKIMKKSSQKYQDYWDNLDAKWTDYIYNYFIAASSRQALRIE